MLVAGDFNASVLLYMIRHKTDILSVNYENFVVHPYVQLAFLMFVFKLSDLQFTSVYSCVGSSTKFQKRIFLKGILNVI